MFFEPSVVSASSVDWSYTTDKSLVTVTSSSTLSKTYPYMTNVQVERNTDDYDYQSGGTSIYKRTVFYRLSSSSFGNKTIRGGISLHFGQGYTISGYPYSNSVNITSITLYSDHPSVTFTPTTVMGDSDSSDIYGELRLNDYYTSYFQMAIAVTYEYTTHFPFSDELGIADNYIEFSKSVAEVTNLALYSAAGQVASADTDVIIGNQQSIAESQAQQSESQHQEEMEQQESIAESQAQQSAEQHEETKGLLGNIVLGILNLPSKILNVLVSVFVPDAEYFTSLFDEMNSFFSERFGLLYYPFEVVIDFANLFVSPDSSGGSVPFPEISWNGTTIISAQDVQIVQDDSFLVLQERLYFVGNVIMSGALINLAYKKINEVMKS